MSGWSLVQFPVWLSFLCNKIHRRTSPYDARSIPTFPDWIRCIKIRIRSGPYPNGLKWRQTPGSFYVKNVQWHRKKIRNIWSRITGNSMSPQRMATLYPRIRTYDHGTHQPQEPDIFPKSSEIVWSTSMMVSLFIRVRHQITTPTRTQNDFVWCTISKTRSLSRRWRKRRSHPITWFTIPKLTQPDTSRQNCQCKRLWFRHHQCYCYTIGRRTNRNTKRFGRLENRRERWEENTIL